MQSITTTTKKTIRNTHNKETNTKVTRSQKHAYAFCFADYCSQLMIFGIIKKNSINT
jgi:hypothetical protein